ncbi:MAG: ABC transporter ATP-binding protein [Candidatus Bipolaricaulota bacterium]|nr:ABC transporter ATP-binding protein [Candidatus Bipolaricaulota bacterium]MBS3792911.1 ABC transporter ATP-binding protein [Candidatus Bipolaricaulota bacterium]
MLRVEKLSKRFGGIQAVKNCSISVEQGTITGLIGPNGAGKTTLFNLITGFHQPDSGRVYFKDEDITDLTPHEIFDRNLFRTFQITREIQEMTVLENLMLIPSQQSGENLWNAWFNRNLVSREENGHEETALEVLEFLEMEDRKYDLAKNLPGGEKKLLDLGRMMMAEPEMVLLDEPGSGVPPSLQNKVNDHVRDISEERGITFLVVEHDMNIIMDLCDPIIVIVDGEKLTEGTPEEVRTDEQVIEAYLGS